MLKSPATATSPKQLVIDNPYGSSGSWYRGNLHVASQRGVGHDLPSAIGRWYAEHGYAFLGISDQNTYAWVSEFGTRSLTGVPTVEASYAFGELLAVGDDHWLPAANLQQAVDWIAGDGALPVLSAGKQLDDQVATPGRLFGLEVYDAHLAVRGQADATALWDRLLSAGARTYAFAGDGVTSLDDPATGHGWIEVRAKAPDLASLLSSLRRGSFYASSGAQIEDLTVEGRTITVRTPADGTIRFIGMGGRLLQAVIGSSARYVVTGQEKYVRVEVLADEGGRAWSQPLFLSWR